ncbi:WecB/TagA/CpsF family glycosyltransferase [Amnibacterium kyonggiense]
MRTPDRRAEGDATPVAPVRRTTPPLPRHTAAPLALTRGKTEPAVSLYGMSIDTCSRDEALARVLRWAASPVSRVVVTPNTDHFIRWQRSEPFRELYLGADLTVIDGAPLATLARMEGISATRITGVDLFMDAAAAAAQQRLPLALIGGAPGVAEQAARRLTERFPGLDVVFTTSPSEEDLRSEEWLIAVARELRRHPEKIVALCLGSPKQEQLFRDLERVDPGLSGVYLCVGAAVDFAAGTLHRAPVLMQRLGIEWLFRFAVEPRRLFRRYFVDDWAILGYLLRSTLRRMLGRTRTTSPRPAVR